MPPPQATKPCPWVLCILKTKPRHPYERSSSVCSDVQAIIFVVDSTDRVRMCVAKEELEEVVRHKQVRGQSWHFFWGPGDCTCSGVRSEEWSSGTEPPGESLAYCPFSGFLLYQFNPSSGSASALSHRLEENRFRGVVGTLPGTSCTRSPQPRWITILGHRLFPQPGRPCEGLQVSLAPMAPRRQNHAPLRLCSGTISRVHYNAASPPLVLSHVGPSQDRPPWRG